MGNSPPPEQRLQPPLQLQGRVGRVALYICEIGSELAQSNLGYQLGGMLFSGLLFADDIVLISRTFLGLESLVSMVKERCDRLKLVISPSKSNIVTP